VRRTAARSAPRPARTNDHAPDDTDDELAATMCRACRIRGEAVRKLIDCLIGAVAVRADVEVLHADADFATLACHPDLRVDEVSLH
jgi:predicted nucleic acid-binding protein